MRSYQTSEVVVTDQPQGMLVPVGIVSAQDIVTRVIASGLDPVIFTAGDIAWSGPGHARVADTVSDALQLLQATNSTALPLIDDDGALAGMMSMDDLLLATSLQLRRE
jgi:CBS domain-containing protein